MDAQLYRCHLAASSAFDRNALRLPLHDSPFVAVKVDVLNPPASGCGAGAAQA
jgi:hypothetical protein